MNEKIVIVLINEHGQQIVLDSISQPAFSLINVAIVKNEADISPLSLIYSFAATPARYLEAGLQKIISEVTQPIFLINSLAAYTELTWHLVLENLQMIDKTQCTVFGSQNDIPLGIYIPGNCLASFAVPNRLRYMSCVSAALDRTFLLSNGIATNLLTIERDSQFNQASGAFVNAEHLTLYKTIAAHYVNAKMLQKHENKPVKIAVMPYHAGDVLMACVALQQIQHDFNRIMVNRCYTDIVKRILPEMIVEVINSDPPLRGHNVDSDEVSHYNNEALYFLKEIYPKIPLDAMVYYARPTRDPNIADFQHVDQWRFAFQNGYEISLADDDNQFSITLPRPVQKSILLHFDGGWPIKVYPHHYQLALTQLLKQANYKITVISDKALSLPVDGFVNFTNLAHLETLMRSHHLFLGMDSFPAHFATRVLKHPSIVLFASTKRSIVAKENSRLLYADDNHLPCQPCHSWDKCPAFQDDYCHNFFTPQQAFAAIENMFADIYKG